MNAVLNQCGDADPQLLSELQSFESDLRELVRSAAGPRDQQPQELRACLNRLDRKVGSLVNLLISKGLITPQEYVARLHEMAREELEAQERMSK